MYNQHPTPSAYDYIGGGGGGGGGSSAGAGVGPGGVYGGASSESFSSPDYAEVAMPGADIGNGMVDENNHYDMQAPRIRGKSNGGARQQQNDGQRYSTFSATSGGASSSNQQQESTYNTLAQRGGPASIPAVMTSNMTNDYDGVTYDSVGPTYATPAADGGGGGGGGRVNHADLYAVPMKGARLRANSKVAHRANSTTSEEDADC